MEDGPSVDDWSKQARFHLEQGRYAFAILDARYVLTKDPRSEVARSVLRASANADAAALDFLKMELQGPLGEIVGANLLAKFESPALPAPPPPPLFPLPR